MLRTIRCPDCGKTWEHPTTRMMPLSETACDDCHVKRVEAIKSKEFLPVGGLSCVGEEEPNIALFPDYTGDGPSFAGRGSSPYYLNRRHDEMSPLQEQLYKNYEDAIDEAV